MSDGYRTAQELGITDAERAAMIKTMDVLHKEQIIFNMNMGCWTGGEGDEMPHHPVNACGTHACIGGTMSLLMQNGMVMPRQITLKMARAADDYVCSRYDDYEQPLPVHRLFFDGMGGEHDGDTRDTRATPAEGIAAIKEFLSGNTEDPWKMRDQA